MANKNYDPFMHTAEHLLNGAMIKKFGIRSFSQHIERKKSKCDYNFDRNLTQEEIFDLEKYVKEAISKKIDVIESFLSLDDAKKILNLDKLPNDQIDKVRIIKIGEYDICPCIGDHVKNTSEIESFRITSTSFNYGKLRIIFKR